MRDISVNGHLKLKSFGKNHIHGSKNKMLVQCGRSWLRERETVEDSNVLSLELKIISQSVDNAEAGSEFQPVA